VNARRNLVGLRLGQACFFAGSVDLKLITLLGYIMRLATILTFQGPRLAAQVGGRFIDLQAADLSLPSSVKGLLAGGSQSLERALAAAKKPGAKSYDQSVKLLPPIPDPEKIICLGLNYRDHAAESGVPLPKDPILFSKYSTALIGQGDAIVLPAISQEVDYEAELVIVVGRSGRHIKPEEALQYVAGYTVGHDVSARDWQLKKDGNQWMAGKTFDTFAPIGPVLVTADEVPNPHNLPIRLRLNGQIMQDSNTREMIFDVKTIIAHLSKIFTLHPGDLIFTGTPPGVGMARKPPVYLKAGDVVEVEIDGLGLLRNPVIQG
jgi:2-keto-4-pentenoate hydratase/2-oxohepta-3-ene-1,7-dioic acid hydratase in catechol pathway